MQQVITRTFRSEDQAVAAARDLLNSGFPRDRLHILAYRGESAGGDDEIIDELRKVGVGREDAKDCVKGLRDGQVLLTATPPDVADQTASILDRHEPIDAGRQMSDQSGSDHVESDGGDDPAPLSHALHLKVLSDDPAPLSHLLHIPVLTDD